MVHKEILEAEKLVKGLPEKIECLRKVINDVVDDLMKIQKASAEVKKDMKYMGTLTKLCTAIGGFHSMLEMYISYLNELIQELVEI